MITMFYFAVLLSLMHVAVTTDHVCMCGNAPCTKLPDPWDPDAVEVMIACNSSQDIKTVEKWKWNSLTSVMDYNTKIDNNSRLMMCKAHHEGKRYAVYVDYHPDIDANDTVISDYINDIIKKISKKFADIVALNLLSVLGGCDYTKGHVQPIINALSVTFTQLKVTKVKVLCVLPWRPVCVGQDCRITTFLSTQCDMMALAAESFFSYCDDSCIAKATTQASKISFGVTEYEMYGFRNKQILLGIAWHGYEYTCVNYTKGAAHGICTLKTDDKGVCDVEGSRVVARIGHEMTNTVDLAYEVNNYSRADEAPWKLKSVPKTGSSVNETHMVWYENIGSLFYKYELAKQLGLKGVVIYYGDDLTYTHLEGDKFNDNMWAWVLHDLLVANSTIMRKTYQNNAGLMAGIGVAMFLLGTLLGAIISCIIFRRKRSLKPPFSQDPMDVDEFRDDDNNAL